MPGPGDSLRLARESRGLSLDEVARETRIRIEYLEAMEREQFPRPAGRCLYPRVSAQLRQYLGIDPAEVIAAYEGRNDAAPQTASTGPSPQPARAAAPPRPSPNIRIQPLSPTPVDTRVRYAPSFWLMGCCSPSCC